MDLGLVGAVRVLGGSRLWRTGDAAKRLNVSRQHVVDLCERGDIPFVKIGTHRRIRLADLTRVLRPQAARTREQEKSLWLHRAVLGELMVDPDGVLRSARDNIGRWRNVHRGDGMSVRYLDTWDTIIDEGVDAVIHAMISPDARSCELRQNSPFASALTDQQRHHVLRSFREHWDRKKV